MRKFQWIFFFLLFLPTAEAVPYFAVLADANCSHCHLNPTGGGMRNSHGAMLMSEFSLKRNAQLFDKDYRGRISKYVGVGGDIQLQHLSTIEPPRSNSFTVPEGTLYVSADPFSHLTLYTDTDLVTVVSREAYGLIHNLPGKSWIKFGRLNLPYGLRLQDDSSFIRGDLGLTFALQDIGIELGAEPGPFTVAGAFINGVGGGLTDNNDGKAVSLTSQWRQGPFRLGGSFLFNNAVATRTLTGGSHMGIHLGRLAFLGELDLQQLTDKSSGTHRTIFVGLGETDFQLVQGLFLKGIYDGIDDQLAGSGLHHRVSAGIEMFPMPHLRTSLLYRLRIGPGALGDDQIVGVIHGFF